MQRQLSLQTQETSANNNIILRRVVEEEQCNASYPSKLRRPVPIIFNTLFKAGKFYFSSEATL